MRFLIYCLVAASIALPVSARGFIRDAEIESTLRRIAEPVLRAAGLSPSSIRIILINDPEMNAFVIGSDAIFIHSGMLMRLETVPMIQAVIAHEAAHIVSGHQISRNIGAAANGRAAALGMILAGIAAGTGNSEAALPLAMTAQQVALRRQFAHSRAQEASADQASVRTLARAGIDPKAALETLNLFRGQEIMATTRVDPYVLTHPLNSQRRKHVENIALGTRFKPAKPDPSLTYWHRRMVAKLNGFIRNPKSQLRRLAASDRSEIATYIRAIAHHRNSAKKSQGYLNALIKARPKDPFYRELRGQFNYENGRIDAAIADYQKALNLAPKEGLIAAGLARALLANDTRAADKKALTLLQKAYAKDSANPAMLRDMALAFARLGNPGRASLATAERYALLGRLGDAGIHANRAKGLLKRGTASWKKAQDIAALSRKSKKQDG